MTSDSPRRTRLLACAAAVTVTALLGACSSSSSGGGGTGGQGSAAAPDTLVAAWPSDISTMDPGNVNTDQDKELAMNVYQNLVGYETVEEDGYAVSDGLAAAPALAESWEIEGDTVTFTLRDDVTFHPSGNPLTSADVVWSLQRALELNGAVELNNSGVFEADQITAPDDTHVAISYQDAEGEPVPASEVNIATLRTCWYGVIDSAAALEHATDEDPIAADWLKENVAGSGPYYVEGRQPGQSLDLAAVPDAVVNPAAFAGVNLRVSNDGNVASLLRGGSVNIAQYGISPRDAQDLGEAGFRVEHANTPSYLFVQIASDTGPFTDPLVRRAVAEALPYDQILDTVYYGEAERAVSYVAESAAGYEPAWEAYGDAGRAQELMDEAGNPDITTTLRYPSDNADFATAAQLIKSALEPIGINVTLQPQTSAAIITSIIGRATADSAGAPDDGIVLSSLSTYVEDAKTPVKLWSVTGGVVNFPRTSIAEIDDLQHEFAMAAPSPEREDAYRQIQQLAAEDASFIPLVVTGRNLVSAQGVTGLTFTPEPLTLYWTLEPAQ
ncbi:ABC transporter substrate-binding protein [Streptomyces avicenniae]|uniref:ABC transporter substrate-binding protein n=1 Tax=Streptomyces avicenniae TaxID=500153 RepID=UPI00069BDAD9|nr:ABC transporter substrate-binding protein [Streptomyces avicenniae]